MRRSHLLSVGLAAIIFCAYFSPISIIEISPAEVPLALYIAVVPLLAVAGLALLLSAPRSPQLRQPEAVRFNFDLVSRARSFVLKLLREVQFSGRGTVALTKI